LYNNARFRRVPGNPGHAFSRYWGALNFERPELTCRNRDVLIASHFVSGLDPLDSSTVDVVGEAEFAVPDLAHEERPRKHSFIRPHDLMHLTVTRNAD